MVKGSPRLWSQGPSHLGTGSAAELVRDAYRRFGAGQFLRELAGSFALAVIDLRDQSVTLAIDRMGIERLAYSRTPQGLAFSSSAERIARLPGQAAGIDRQAIYDYLFLHMVPAPRTIFRGVSKLPAATSVEYRDGKLTMRRYWDPVFAQSSTVSADELAEELRAALDRAMRRCHPATGSGAFLSGGLDSSTVSGYLSRLMPGHAKTFSIGFGEGDYDELRFARIANEHFGCMGHEHVTTPADIVRTFQRIATAYDEPFGNSSAVPTLLCAELALEHDVHHLLAGDGGDEIFTGNERYARQLLFESYHRLPGWARKLAVDPLSRAVAPDSRIMPLRKLRSFVEQARIPLPQRLETWNFLYRNDQETMLHPDFLADVDPQQTLERLQQVYESAPSPSVQDKLLYYDWQFTLADNDLRKVGTMCDHAGVRVSYPMLDEDVVGVALRIPPHVRMRRLQLRSFYKDAMRGFLPDQIINKTKHGFGLPFGIWLHQDKPLADLVYGCLSELKRWEVVRPDFIDNLIQRHREEPSSYLGYPIWSFAMLSAWLSIHSTE